MKRNKRIVVLAHCILNANSKVDGLSLYPGSMNPLIQFFLSEGIGMIQLPCPETQVYGIRRWGHVKEQFSHPFFRKQISNLVEPTIMDLVAYRDMGYDIMAIIGIDGSPSCGVSKTCSSSEWFGELENSDQLMEKKSTLIEVESPGVFIEEIVGLMQQYQLDIPFLAVDEICYEESVQQVIETLKTLI